jgi:transposase
MAAPYSEDLRIRVLAEFDKKKLTIEEIKTLFNVDRKTIYRWRKRRTETGTISPIKNFQKGHSHKITDLEKFRIFVTNNSDLTTKEMAAIWGNITPYSIGRYLKKINFTFKKNSWIIKNVTK